MSPLFAVALDVGGQTIALWITSILAAIGAVNLAFRGNTKIKDRRDSAIDLYGNMKEHGFEVFMPLVRAYIAGNYSEVWTQFKALVRIFSNPEQVLEIFRKSFNTQFARRLSTPEGREEIVAALRKEGMQVSEAPAISEIADVIRVGPGE